MEISRNISVEEAHEARASDVFEVVDHDESEPESINDSGEESDEEVDRFIANNNEFGHGDVCDDEESEDFYDRADAVESAYKDCMAGNS